jgi:sortase (surface protein transpeptidase)
MSKEEFFTMLNDLKTGSKIWVETRKKMMW